jgi:signal transduction histidine kinase
VLPLGLAERYHLLSAWITIHGGQKVTGPPILQNIVPLEASVPTASLDSILCTKELLSRPRRPPDHEKENSALVVLVSALADSPRTILQTLADKVLEILDADSAGLSLLTKDEKTFYWAAIAGAWRPHLGGGTPRDFGPCGDVLDRNVPMLFTHWERRYPYLSSAMPLAEEGLLVPFYVNGKAVGTIWTIAHRNDRKFDAEDLRLLESMGRFASAAYRTVQSIEELRSEIAAREKAETELRKLTDSLEAEVQVRTHELEHRNAELAEARARVAEVARVTSLGVLTASIAHEVNQPIATARNNAASALRFLSRNPPDLEEMREALECVVSDVDRAGNVIGGIRKLITKTPAPRDDCFDINEAIREMIVLTRGEALKNGVTVQMQLEGLPLIQGDRVQLQQVVLNLILNAVEAMSSVDGARRELSISTERRGADEVLVAVRDSGPGIDSEHLERVFDSFYTTKPSGIGLGLSICRSIIDAHGGRLWAAANEPRGAAFQFTLPAGNQGS